MPVQITVSPLLSTQRSPVDISSLIDLLRSKHASESLKLADALDQLQRGIYALERVLRSDLALPGDDIKITDATGSLGTQLTGSTITITSGTNTITIAPTYVDVETEFRVNGTKVMGARQTGWAAPSATQSRAALPNGATTTQIEQALSALITDLITQGTIGP